MSDTIPTLPGDEIQDTFTSTIRLATGVSHSHTTQNYTTHRTGIASCTGYSGAGEDKPILWVETTTRRYEPQVDDYIIGTIVEKNSESYKLDIGTGQMATLSTIAFDGATRHNCPRLEVGELVYCRVAIVNRFLVPELTCCALINKRDWVTGEAMFGPLKGGMMVNVSIKFAHELMSDDNHVLNTLGNKIRFEIAIGMNGNIWVDSETIRYTIIIINTLTKADLDPNINVELLVDRAIQLLTGE
jgi:exosome complex component RRP40